MTIWQYCHVEQVNEKWYIVDPAGDIVEGPYNTWRGAKSELGKFCK